MGYASPTQKETFKYQIIDIPGEVKLTGMNQNDYTMLYDAYHDLNNINWGFAKGSIKSNTAGQSFKLEVIVADTTILSVTRSSDTYEDYTQIKNLTGKTGNQLVQLKITNLGTGGGGYIKDIAVILIPNDNNMAYP